MKSVLPFFVLFAQCIMVNAQARLNWSESFVSDTHLNQIAMAMDSTGNAWCMMVPEGAMHFEELTYNVEAPAHAKNVIVRINSAGKTDRVVSIEGKNSGAGIGAIACNVKNEVWILAPYASSNPEVRSMKNTVVVQGDTLPGGLLLSAVTADGQIRFAVDLPIRWANESFFITFDRQGNAHILTSWIDLKYDPYNGHEVISHPHYHLTHTIVNDAGKLVENHDFYMGEMRGSNCRMSQIHFTPRGDYYITTRFNSFIEQNGKVLIKDTNPTPKNEYDRWEGHAVLMHFDPKGKMDWHRLFYGHGSQLISSLTSDSTNVYFAVNFNYECSSNAENQISYDDSDYEIVEGMERVCMDHRGKMKWIDRISGRRNYTSGLTCRGIETDHKGQLIYFCSFRDTLVIHGEEKDFKLDWVKYTNDESFVLIADTAGHVVDVRRDLYSKEGRGFGLSSSSHQNTFALSGVYFTQFVGTEFNSTLSAWTKGDMRTDLHIELNGKKGSDFKNQKYSGGVFVYSFDQPLLKPAEEKPEDPFYVNQPDPQALEELLVESEPKPNEEVQPEASKPAVTTEESIAMNLFPNPSRFGLTIRLSQLSGPSELFIHDAAGTLILSKVFFAFDPEMVLQYNVSEWSAGRYLVTCISGGEKITKILVVTG